MIQVYQFVIMASYGNDSVALIQWAYENALPNTAILYNDTGWAQDGWNERIKILEGWAQGLGFETHRTQSIGLEALVRAKKGWPRQGIQFCTAHLKIAPTHAWLDARDSQKLIVIVIGVRREESSGRTDFPEFKYAEVNDGGRDVWAPLVRHTEAQRDALLERAGVEPLPHRSMECFPCINSNRADLRELAKDDKRIAEIEAIEKSLGETSNGKPRTMFRPYRYMGATGIREIVRWAEAERGEFSLDDGGGAGCESGWCRS